jgi:hypothetical protein
VLWLRTICLLPHIPSCQHRDNLNFPKSSKVNASTKPSNRQQTFPLSPDSSFQLKQHEPRKWYSSVESSFLEHSHCRGMYNLSAAQFLVNSLKYSGYYVYHLVYITSDCSAFSSQN